MLPKALLKNSTILYVGLSRDQKKLEKASAQGVTIISAEEWKDIASKKNLMYGTDTVTYVHFVESTNKENG